MKKLVTLLFILGMTASVFGQQQRITERLQDILKTTDSDDYVPVLVVFDRQVDVQAMDARFYRENASLERRTYEVITSLQALAEESQNELIPWLDNKRSAMEVFDYKPFWVVNMIQVEAKPSAIYELASRTSVATIDHDGVLQWDKPVSVKPSTQRSAKGSEPGLDIINARKLWEMGITGEGRIVMGIDTGVDPSHPALVNKWLGNDVPAAQAWYDPQGSTNPNDCDGHGTHTMGTMTGIIDGDTVGVAPGAKWMASNTLCAGSPHTSGTIAAFQWAMDADNDPNTITGMPDAISNSWYDPAISNECESIYKTTLDAVEAVGIAVVFSAGNSGPGTTTITTPKNINTDEVNVWATGAIDGDVYLGGSNTPIASFSSRGPSTCGGTGSLLIKPEASAPGVDVRSAYPGGGYSDMSGTSMACPHIAGAIALLKQFAPSLTGKQIKMALYNTAKDLGEPGEDNVYGMGLIDVYAAFLSLGTPDDTPPEPIVDLAATDMTSNSITIQWTVPADTSMNGVTGYDIRMSTSAINDTNDFNAATPLTFPGQPGEEGEIDMLVIEGLEFSTEYYFAIRCRDIWSNWSPMSNVASTTTYDAPEMEVTPESVMNMVSPGAVVLDTVLVKNVSVTPSTLNYNIEMTNNTFPEDKIKVAVVAKAKNNTAEGGTKDNPVEKGGVAIEGFGGPDLFGYEWIDSDEENGPDFVWEDISATGTMASSWTPTGTFDPEDEGYAGPFDLGFSFKFYGQEYTQIYASSNGFLSFEPISVNTYGNDPIPDSEAPNAIISALWDDLDGTDNGDVYYKQDGNRFIIQYDNWGEYSGGGTYTFQVVLHSSGKVLFYYYDLSGDINSATVGLENQDGSDGLQIVKDATWLKNNFAAQIAAEPDWLAMTPHHGTIYNGNEVEIQLTFMTEDYPQGTYSMDLEISSNDPANGLVVVPVTMVLGSATSDWEIALNVADAGTESSALLNFGTNEIATDGIDDLLNEYELPPAPPAGVFDARFILPEGLAANLDIRKSGQENITWKVKFQPGTSGYPITLSWDNTLLPPGDFRMTDPIGGSVVNVDMTTQNSVEITNTALDMVEINYSETSQAMMNVMAGWNILSIPLHANDMTVAGMFPDASTSAYMFSEGYSIVDEFSMGLGYWIKFPEAADHMMQGQPMVSSVPVNAGWNIVGPFHEAVDASQVTSEPAGIISSVFYGYNEGYFLAEELQPGKGYWVKTSQAGEISYNMAVPKSESAIQIPEDWGRITMTDAAGRSFTLYTANGNVNTAMYAMPPMPPQGASDFRYSKGSMVSGLSTPQEIVITGAQYPVRISSTKEVTISDAMGGQALYSVMKEGETVTISDASVTRIMVSSAEIPVEYGLGQNYPNPFNPSTNISFSLPVDAKVTLKVFDMLGQQVLTLGNAEYKAGNHKVSINASSLSSGIYLYNIVAEGNDGSKFSNTKKMILMK